MSNLWPMSHMWPWRDCKFLTLFCDYSNILYENMFCYILLIISIINDKLKYMQCLTMSLDKWECCDGQPHLVASAPAGVSPQGSVLNVLDKTADAFLW